MAEQTADLLESDNRRHNLSSRTRPKATPWAVICVQHGQVFLTEDEYSLQLLEADLGWFCPLCERAAEFDDENFDGEGA